MRLLVIEDDDILRETLAEQLVEGGYAIEQAADGREGLYFALEYPIDLAIIDLGLPEMSGLDIIREARKQGKTYPILILTARDRWQDKVDGLTTGADDYVVKPFSVRELMARVEAVLRRSAERPTDIHEITIPGGMVNLSRREVRLDDDVRHELSEREVELLRYLAANGGRAVSRDEILSRVWGIDPAGVMTRTIDMHVARL
ncbi:MAG: response regulator transcription factor, partial [Woeseiaceae bacterium]|nr:response regulator transcription factor [Woeseiaceae bacterium]